MLEKKYLSGYGSEPTPRREDDLQLPFVCGDVGRRGYRWRWGTDGIRYRPYHCIEIAMLYLQ
ncbi:MAG: hypothetical protein WAK60_10180 [Sedimentisphaerales bacterium]